MAWFPRIPKTRPLLRRFVQINIAILVVLVCVGLFLRWSATMPWGHDYVAQQLKSRTFAGQRVIISGIDGDLLGKFSVANLQVEDDEGTWLVAHDIDLDWSAWPLLFKKVSIEELVSEDIAWSRRPNISTAGQSRQPASRPWRFHLGAVLVNELRVSALPRQQEQTYRLAGSLERDFGRGRLSIDLQPEETTGDRATGTLSWGEALPLAGRIQAQGPEDGLLKQVLGIVEPGALLISIDGRGRIADWTIQTEIELDDRSVATLDATGARMTGQGTGTVDLSVFAATQDIARRTGQTIAFSGEKTDSNLVVELEGPAARLQAGIPIFRNTGQLDLSEIDIAFESAAPDQLIGIRPVSFDELSASGVLNVSAKRLRFRGDAEASGADIYGHRARQLAGPFDISWSRQSPRLTVSGDIKATRFRAATSQLRQIIGSSPNLNGRVRFDFEQGEMSARDLRAEMRRGAVRLNGSASLDLTELDLAATGDLAGPDNSWTLRRSQLDIKRTAGGTIRFDAKGRARFDERGLVEAPWTGKSLDVTAAATFASSTGWQFPVLTARGDGIEIVGGAGLSGGLVSGEFDVSAADTRFSTIAFEQLQGRIGISGRPGKLSATGRLAPEGLTISGEKVADVSTLVFAQQASSGVTGRVEFDGRWRNQDVHFAGAPRLAGLDWDIPELTARIGKLTATGRISGRGGDLSAVLADLNLDGEFQLAGMRPRLKGQVALLDQTARTDLTISKVSSGPLFIDMLRLVGDGTRENFRGTASLDASLNIAGQSKPLTLSSPLDANLQTLEVTLSPDGFIDRAAVKTLSPIVLNLAPGKRSMSGELGVWGGAIAVSAAGTVPGQMIDLSILDMDLNKAGPLISRPSLRGLASANFALGRDDTGLNGSGRVNIQGLASGPPDTPTADFVADLTLADKTLQIDGRGTDQDDDLTLTYAASLPLKLSETGQFSGFDIEKNARLTMHGGGPISGLWWILGGSSRLDGDVDLNMDWQGPLNRLRPTGFVKFENGEFEDAEYGIYLTDIATSARLNPQAIEVDTISAKGSKGGTLSGAGRYGFDGIGEVAITLDKVRALQRSDISASVSGELNVTRAPTGARVAGDLEFDRVNIELDRLPRRGYTTLDVKFPDLNGEPETREPDPIFPVRLNVDLKARRGIFVSGQGVRSEWRLNANLGGLLQNPQLQGRANTVQGDLAVAGRSFEFVDSAVLFNGDLSSSRLQVTAERQAPVLTARILVTGTANHPRFALESDPVVPEDEILSRILFGQSPAQLTPFQAAQLASALASLSGESALDLVGTLQDALDIDRLDFDTTAEGETTIGAGKYLTQDVYVEVRTTPVGAPGLGVEWTPRRNIVVGTELDSEESPRFTIKWKKDFNLDRAPVSDPDERLADTTPDEPGPDTLK